LSDIFFSFFSPSSSPSLSSQLPHSSLLKRRNGKVEQTANPFSPPPYLSLVLFLAVDSCRVYLDRVRLRCRVPPPPSLGFPLEDPLFPFGAGAVSCEGRPASFFSFPSPPSLFFFPILAPKGYFLSVRMMEEKGIGDLPPFFFPLSPSHLPPLSSSPSHITVLPKRRNHGKSIGRSLFFFPPPPPPFLLFHLFLPHSS